MRIALVHPHLFHHPAPTQPSGLAWLGAALRTRGHTVRLLDLSFVWNRSRAIPRFLRQCDPDVIALTVPYLDNECAFHALSFLPGTRWIADALRAASRAPIVAGGWGVSHAPEDVLRYLGLRFGFAGGDLGQACDWIEAVGSGHQAHDVAGAIRWDGGGYRVSPREAATRPGALLPAIAAYDLIDLARHETHGGAAVIPVGLAVGTSQRRREPAEIDHEVGALLATSSARRVIFAGARVGDQPDEDVALLDRLAMRGPALAWELHATAGALTREHLHLARRGGACAVRLAAGEGEGLDDLRRALEVIARSVPVLVEIHVGGPAETSASLERKLAELSKLREHARRVVLRPGDRLWAPAADHVHERRGGAAGDSYVWPRFGLARPLEPIVLERLRDATAPRAGWSLDSDGYAPWQRLAHALSRRSGVWPAWRLDRYLADLRKLARAA